MPAQQWDEYGNPIETDGAEAWDEHGRPVRAQVMPPPSHPQPRETPAPRAPRSLARQIEGGLANLNRGIPFSNDISGAGAALAAGGRELAHQFQTPERGPLDIFGLRAAMGDAYQAQTDRTREVGDEFRNERPLAGNFLEGTGMAATIVPSLMMGATGPGALSRVAPRVAERAPGVIGQMARGAPVGGAYGFAYGAGGQDQAGEGWQDRLAAGNEGLALGAALGGAAPAAVNTFRAGMDLTRPAWRALAHGAERIPTPEPNSVGAMGRPMRRRAPPPRRAPEQSIPGPAVGAVERMARRARMTPDELQSAFARARDNPQGEVVADALRDPGTRTLRAIAQAPGETGERVAQVAAARSQAQPDRIIGALRRSLGVNESRQGALRRLGREYEDASANMYRPVFRQRLSSEGRSGLEGVFAQFADDPIMRDAMNRADRIFQRDQRLGRVAGNINDSFARYAHYVKMGLDDAVSAAPVGSRGIQATELNGVYEMRSRIVQALDDNIPGYAEARARWGGLRSAEEALDEGKRFLNMNADEVQVRVGEMTPFEREHARIGFADAISERIGRSGRVVGNANVANSALLNSPEGQRRIAAMFDSPEQAADFLATVNTQNRLMRNATAWGGGSSTFSNLAHGEDNAAAAVAEGVVDTLRGEAGRVVHRTARQVGNLITDGAVERANNQTGEVLLRRIDNAEAKEFTDELVRLLRQRETRRATTARASRYGSAAAGARDRERR